MTTTQKPSLFCLCDTPTVNTGFGHVARNLLTRWIPHFERIDIWGINYLGWPHEYPFRIFPAGTQNWNSVPQLTRFLNQLKTGGYTHLFILIDPQMLSVVQFPKRSFVKELRSACDDRGIKIVFYYPVDSPMTPNKEWLDPVMEADVRIAYNQYGYDETVKVRSSVKPHIIPHGVDASIYYPREDRDSIRAALTKGSFSPDDFLLLNVNRNERRKAPHLSLQILAELKKRGMPAKLLMHCPNMALNEGISLDMVGEQLGVKCGKDWTHNDHLFVNYEGTLVEQQLNLLYNMSDMVLSTSSGEGWGLSLSAALATGCLLAAPDHTGCKDVMDGAEQRGQVGQCVRLPVSKQCIVNPLDWSRVRYPVDVFGAADAIEAAYRKWDAGELPARFVLNDTVKDWLSWDRIAGEFIKVML